MTTAHSTDSIAQHRRAFAIRALVWRLALLALFAVLCCATAKAATTSIHGVVTSHLSGQPRAGVTVEFYDAQFLPLFQVTVTDANGAYQWSGDCPDAHGTVCYASVGQSYDDLHLDGARVSFANGAQDAVVDIAQHTLAHLHVTVNEAPGSTGAYPVTMFYYDERTSTWYGTYGLQGEGAQGIGGFLSEGRYRLCVGGLGSRQQRQCFDHQPEAGTWAQQTYTEIVLGEAEQRDDVTFDLQPGGSISGTLRDAAKGVPLTAAPFNGHWVGGPSSVYVDLYDADGAFFDRTYTPVDDQGRYTVRGTPNGAFRVQITSFRDEFRDPVQVYPGVACHTTPCPIGAGTPVATLDHGTVSGIDLSLHPNVTIHGTVTDAATHEPIAGVNIAVWHEIPPPFEAPPQYEVYWTQSDAQGNYVACAASGPYGVYVSAGAVTYVSSLYPGNACASGVESLCLLDFPWMNTQPADAAVAVNANTGDDIRGVDFALQAGGAFSGYTLDPLGTPLYGRFTVYDSSGADVTTFIARSYDASGNLKAYQSPALPPGTYYASASIGYGGPCLVYAARPCPEQGQTILDIAPTPITISAGAIHAGINFQLPTDRVFGDRFGG